MRLYIAGLYASNFNLHGNLFRRASKNAQLLRRAVELKLESYHYLQKGKMVENLRRDGEKVFLDSGAFSAFTQGVTIQLEDYAEFIHGHQDIIEMASVLDAIGDADATWTNQKELERRGCEVLPCFHYGEPFEVAEYYATNYEYISIGGMVPVSNQKLRPWLDELWSKHLTDSDGYSITKVHGFGMTARPLIQRYPWYSVDSSSWVQVALNGAITFKEIPTVIPISSMSPLKKVHGQHFDTKPELEQRYISDLLIYYGLSVEEVKIDYKARWALNALTYHLLGHDLGDDHWRKPFRAEQDTLY